MFFVKDLNIQNLFEHSEQIKNVDSNNSKIFI